MLWEGVIREIDQTEADWDGEDEVYIVAPFVTGERKSYASLDDRLKRNMDYKLPPRVLTKMVFYFANRYIKKLREK